MTRAFCQVQLFAVCKYNFYRETRRLDKIIPAATSAELITCIQLNGSCKMITASRLLNIRIRLPNRTVLAAPSLWIAMFQIGKQITEAPRPRYKMENSNLLFQCTGAE